jgi:hypothetical protein
MTFEVKQSHPFDAVIPLFKQGQSSDDLAATGSCVWVDIEGEQFLLTAAHVTDARIAGDILLVPAGEQLAPPDGTFVQLGKHGLRDKRSLAVDAAYFHISSGFADRLKPRYSPISRRRIDMMDEVREGDLYSIAGYPAAASTMSRDRCSAEFFGLIGVATHDRLYRKHQYSREVHLLVKFNVRRNQMLRGSASYTPEPWGMSGGGIFSWPQNANSLEPNPDPRLVAITTDWNQRRAFFAGTQIYFFIKMIEISNPGLLQLIPADRR